MSFLVGLRLVLCCVQKFYAPHLYIFMMVGGTPGNLQNLSEISWFASVFWLLLCCVV